MTRFLLKDGDGILFVGDSITDCGRRAQAAPLGDGYVKMFQEIVTARKPDLKLRIVNRGIGGNTVIDLRHRWHDDVLREQFDWLAVKIGINDLHRFLAGGAEFAPERFAQDYDAILSETSARKQARTILIDPFYLSTDTSGIGFRSKVVELLPAYLAAVEELAHKYGALHLKTQAMFQRCLGHHAPDEFCPEPVHPYRSGHLAIALEIYHLLGGTL